MIERKDREPGFDGIDALDETHHLSAGLRSEDRHADERSVQANRSESVPESAGTAEIPHSAASGLRARVPPMGLDLDDTQASDPGRAIRRAREALGLDATTLAYRIRLSLRTIEDLESNRLDTMPPAYVRGYLRAIARELSSDSEVWIRAYEGLGYTEPVLRPTLQKKGPVRARRRMLRRLGLVLLLVAGTGGGAFVYVEREHGDALTGFLAWTQSLQARWLPAGPAAEPAPNGTQEAQERQDETGPRDTAAAESTPSLERADPLTELDRAVDPDDSIASAAAPLQLESLPDPSDDVIAHRRPPEAAADATPASDLPVVPSATPSLATPGSESPLVSDTPLLSEASLPSDEPLPSAPTLASQEPLPGPSGLQPDRSIASDEPGPNAVDRTAGDPPAPAAATAPSADSPAVSMPMADASAIPDEARPGSLRLEFQQTSWIEIRSASDRVVLQGVFHPGDDQALSVQLPARVMLGNAPGVTLHHQGIPVALEPHTRDNRTARFSLEAP